MYAVVVVLFKSTGMAIAPFLMSLSRELEREYRRLEDDIYDDDFGFGIHPLEIFRPTRTSLYLQPRRRLAAPYDRNMHAVARRGAGRGGADKDYLAPVVGKNGFQVCVDVSKFKPNELTVKTVDNMVVVEGKHEEREDDHGLIERHFVRKYLLPQGYDAKEVVSTISSDGVLTVKAPPPASQMDKRVERVVQIQQTGPAHLSVKAPEQPEASNKDQNGATPNATGAKK